MPSPNLEFYGFVNNPTVSQMDFGSPLPIVFRILHTTELPVGEKVDGEGLVVGPEKLSAVAVEVNDFPELLTPPPPNEVTLATIKNPILWGADEFWTFVVSARETDYPIPVHYPGLPPYLVTFHKAAEEAKQTLAAKSVTLSRYYSLGHRGDFYQFDAAQDGSVLVDCHSLRIVERRKTLVRAADVAVKKSTLTPEQKEHRETMLKIYRQQVQEAWGQVRRRFDNTDGRKGIP